MRAWVLAVLVALPLAGCAQESPPELLKSSEALAAAEAYLGDPEAVLLGLSSYEGQLDDSTVEWLEEKGFRTDVADEEFLDGRSTMWLVRYALPTPPGYTPRQVTLQVMADEVRENPYEGRPLEGDGEGAGHHNADDICFTQHGSTTIFDLDILENLADSTAIADALRKDPRLASFMPDVQRIDLSLNGARTSYGLLPEYWCWEREQEWTFIAHGGEGTFRGVFTMQGELIAALDWSQGAGAASRDVIHHITDDALAMGQSLRHEFPVEVSSDIMWMRPTAMLNPGRGAEDLRLELVAPDGTVVDESMGPGAALFKTRFPAEGTWTIAYSYTATLPLSEHELRLHLSTYGPL